MNGGFAEVVRHGVRLRGLLDEDRAGGHRVAVVSTMGGLHAGHRALIREAACHADRVVVTVFVNPMEFAPSEDFENHPRMRDEDLRALRAGPVDYVYVPGVDDVYPGGSDGASRVEVPEIGTTLDGASRPGYFRGVATFACILFNVVGPAVAVFGEKDFQQLLVVRRMVDDLHLPIVVVGVPTVRERDGLALSSRNAHLSSDERARAPLLHRVLGDAAAALAAGDRDFHGLGLRAMNRLDEAGFRPDYVSVRNALTLASPTAGDDPLIVLAAAWLGRTRLIDNVQVLGRASC